MAGRQQSVHRVGSQDMTGVPMTSEGAGTAVVAAFVPRSGRVVRASCGPSASAWRVLVRQAGAATVWVALCLSGHPARGEPIVGSIVFVSNQSGNWELWAMEGDSRRVRQLTHTKADERCPAWSPDGQQIAYADNRGDLWLMAANGNACRRLAEGTPGIDQPGWHPTGTRLAFVSFLSVPQEDSDIWEVQLDKAASPRKLVASPQIESHPRWSPDGRQVLYSQFHRGPENQVIQELWLTSVPEGETQRLTRTGGQNYQARWSPDGGAIAFASDLAGGNYDIWLLRLKPVTLERLTYAPAMDSEPCWSPKGDQVAFVSTRNGVPQIWVVNADGSGERQLTFGDSSNRSPDWASGVPR